jgi:hypothetical protein
MTNQTKTYEENLKAERTAAHEVADSTIKVFWLDGQCTKQGWALYDLWAAWAYR